MAVLRVTIDTSDIDEAPLARLRSIESQGFVDLGIVTVTARERGEVALLDGFEIVPEAMVLDESLLGMAVLGGDEDAERLEAILTIVSSGSFPKPGARDDLTEKQRHQVRDAMILEAHTRAGRDVFVSSDRKAYVNHGKRDALESLCRTRIRTLDELLADLG